LSLAGHFRQWGAIVAGGEAGADVGEFARLEQVKEAAAEMHMGRRSLEAVSDVSDRASLTSC